MKLIVELTSISLIKKYKKLSNISYFMVGYKNLSLNMQKEFTKSELINIYELLKNSNIKLILNAEKLFSDNELMIVKSLIKENFFDIFEYVTYSDFGIKNLLEDEGVNVKFIFKAATYLTNYQDINEYGNINDYVVASSEISSLELIELSKKINKNIIIDIFGMNACFYSRRKLLTNYFLYRNMNNNPNKNNYYIIEELRDELLPIIENECGTVILEPKYHLLLEEIKEINNKDYGIICLGKLNQNSSFVVVEAFNEFLSNNDVNLFYSKLKNHNIPYYKGAYNIKSILLKGGNSCE